MNIAMTKPAARSVGMWMSSYLVLRAYATPFSLSVRNGQYRLHLVHEQSYRMEQGKK